MWNLFVLEVSEVVTKSDLNLYVAFRIFFGLFSFLLLDCRGVVWFCVYSGV